MNCQDGHNTMRTIQQRDLSRLWPLQWSGTVGKGCPFSNAVIQCAFPASKHLKSLELLRHAQLACHCAGFHDPGPRWNHQSSTYLSNTLALKFPALYPIVCISSTFSNIDVVYELTDNTNVLGDTLSITALQTITRGRLSPIRVEDHKEQICRLSCCAWLVWVFSMVQPVPTARLCPKILFCIVTRSLACFCRALGCCIRRLTTLAKSAFICPCPKLLYAWDSYWHFPLATHCTACTQDHRSCNPHRAPPQKAIQGSMRNMQGTMRICWVCGLPSTSVLQLTSATLTWSYKLTDGSYVWVQSRYGRHSCHHSSLNYSH